MIRSVNGKYEDFCKFISNPKYKPMIVYILGTHHDHVNFKDGVRYIVDFAPTTTMKEIALWYYDHIGEIEGVEYPDNFVEDNANRMVKNYCDYKLAKMVM